ncbi:transcriptional regulator GcvA (plasmid) [Pantoea piersonii]|uniref:Transcriptional regulator GcvA n=1 Tax=Pantoea piersonii TaxID=2364647 RepID=A0AAJ5QMJ0_9GAMM|nr:transcriptional regulator GcvA [Pantoea piersonii]WBG93048.1 transcriptional regulator GcvA [Pantoea piersonii]
MRNLPPIAMLRAFEVAARHTTFTATAEELFITQSAVSHQLKNLEEMWGLQLFQRGKTLSLTPAGEALAPLVREFFNKLDTTLSDLREQNGRVRLRVNTTYSFALKWLLPRLPALARLHPEILVSLESSDKAISFAGKESDVAIRFGHGNYHALFTEFMFREQLFPVASPALLQRSGTPAEPAELMRYPLLTRDGADLVPKWGDWFKHVGVKSDVLHENVRFADTNMTIEAALLGQGVALARSGHVEKELADGTLVRLFEVPFPSPAAYYFVCPQGLETQPQILNFRRWLLHESQQAQSHYQ